MVGHLSMSSQPPEFYALLIGQPQLVEIGPGSTPSSKGMPQAYDFSKMVLTSQRPTMRIRLFWFSGTVNRPSGKPH
jgi:hypothetical protein